MKTIIKSNWLSLAFIAGVTLYGVVNYDSLPAQIATRFNWGGEPHQYLDKLMGISILPLLLFGVVILVPLFIRISPKGYQMEQSIPSVARLNFSVALSLSIIQIGIIRFNLHPDEVSIIPFLHATCTLFLLTFGNFLSKIEKNFFIGVRTPWSLVSEKNWFATHRFAAKSSVVGGVILLLSTPFRSHMGWVLTVFAGALFLPFFYSYWFHLSCEKEEAVQEKRY